MYIKAENTGHKLKIGSGKVSSNSAALLFLFRIISILRHFFEP
jgi:hypothetical protein